MATQLFVYSGSGNSLWAAQRLGEALKDEVAILPMSFGAHAGKDISKPDRIGFLFPVHMWGVPRRVRRFIDSIKFSKNIYYFAVALHAGQVARTLVELEEMLLRQGAFLQSGFELRTPANYTPFGGPGDTDKVKAILTAARARLKGEIAPAIEAEKKSPTDKGNPFQCLILSQCIHPLGSSQLGRMGKRFFADSRCTRCGVCARLCPAHNIRLTEDGVRFGSRCEQCFACLQWCPQEAIQCSPKSHRTRRYHNPEIELDEFLSFFAEEPSRDSKE